MVIPLYSTKPTQQFTINRDGTVTDNLALLMWQQADDGIMYNWYEASVVYHGTQNPGSIDVCGDLEPGGYLDWRLPIQDEMRSLVVCTNANGPIVNNPDYPFYFGEGNSEPYDKPTINVQFSCRTTGYWSVSAYNTDGAWLVNFSIGIASWNYRVANLYVRCIR